MNPESIKNRNNETIKIPRITLIIGVAILIALVVFVATNLNEAKKFAFILSQAEPKWLLWALLLQIGTYICAGSIWNRVIRSAGHKVSLRELARLAIEKLSVDQLVPTGGISGNLAAFQTMKRLGLPTSLAAEALLTEIVSHHIAYAIVSASALSVLWFYNDITPAIRYIVSIFAVILIAIPVIIFWLINHRDKNLPSWLLRFHPIAEATNLIKSVSPERINSPKQLAITSSLDLTIFLLDAATLWTTMLVTGYQVGPITAFVAIIVASMAGTVSFLPGGLGGFEAAAVAAFTLFGVPIEAALAGTFLFRGFTLWLPLIPGILMVRRYVGIKI